LLRVKGELKPAVSTFDIAGLSEVFDGLAVAVLEDANAWRQVLAGQLPITAKWAREV
jgi:hypothetical protein